MTFRICQECKRSVDYTNEDIIRIEVIRGARVVRSGEYCAFCAKSVLLPRGHGTRAEPTMTAEELKDWEVRVSNGTLWNTVKEG